MALVLSERGYGKVEEILRSPTDVVLDQWAFMRFRAEYAATEASLNKKDES